MAGSGVVTGIDGVEGPNEGLPDALPESPDPPEDDPDESEDPGEFEEPEDPDPPDPPGIPATQTNRKNWLSARRTDRNALDDSQRKDSRRTLKNQSMVRRRMDFLHPLLEQGERILAAPETPRQSRRRIGTTSALKS